MEELKMTLKKNITFRVEGIEISIPARYPDFPEDKAIWFARNNAVQDIKQKLGINLTEVLTDEELDNAAKELIESESSDDIIERANSEMEIEIRNAGLK
jgi:hypothetical protein